MDVPVNTAYDQWTQFESFPEFMEGVKEVIQLDEKRLRWRAEVAGKDEEWEAEITDQIPDRHIAWRSVTGEPRDATEKVGDALGFLQRRVGGDLERFKKFIESRGAPTGAWRGEIHGGRIE